MNSSERMECSASDGESRHFVSELSSDISGIPFVSFLGCCRSCDDPRPGPGSLFVYEEHRNEGTRRSFLLSAPSSSAV